MAGANPRAASKAACSTAAVLESEGPRSSWQANGTMWTPSACAAALTAVSLPAPEGPCRRTADRNSACCPTCRAHHRSRSAVRESTSH